LKPILSTDLLPRQISLLLAAAQLERGMELKKLKPKNAALEFKYFIRDPKL
jgi:hypothetical protein